MRTLPHISNQEMTLYDTETDRPVNSIVCDNNVATQHFFQPGANYLKIAMPQYPALARVYGYAPVSGGFIDNINATGIGYAVYQPPLEFKRVLAK